MKHLWKWSRPGWPGDVVALAAGALAPLAYAPFGWYPVTVLSVALLFVSWEGLSATQALRRGWWFGLGMFGAGVCWVYISIHEFGGAPAPLALLITAGLIVYLALYPGLVGYLATRFFPSPDGVRTLLVLPAAWVLLEWVRGWFLTGFPWLALGYSQSDAPLAGLAPLLGVYGVGAAVAWSAALLVWTVRGRDRQRAYALLGVLVLWGGAALLQHDVDWTRPTGKPVRAVLLQGNISQAVKWELDQRVPTLERYLDLTREHWNADLIVWPETAIPVFYHQVADKFVARLEQLAREHGTDLLVGIPVLDRDRWNYYNAMMSLGRERGFYYKRHLVPFGEYLPLRKTLGGVLEFMNIPMSDFSSGGADQPLLRVAGYPVGISICFEAAFGEEIIRELPQAAFLVNVSNDAWFGNSLAPHQHLQIARMRALETGRYLLRATNTGISAIIDDRGRVVTRSAQFTVAALTGKVQPRAGATPYVRFGNRPVVALAVLALALALLMRARRARAAAAVAAVEDP